MKFFEQCPKCNHQPLPKEQRTPSCCPCCGVIFEKVVEHNKNKISKLNVEDVNVVETKFINKYLNYDYLLKSPNQTNQGKIIGQSILLILFTLWGLQLISLDYKTGEIMNSFIHGPLLIFHEAGHVIFRLFGTWIMVLGGTLGQLLMPIILGTALIVKNRDPFGASIGLWLLGISILDVSPYMYDALSPQLMLLSGKTGEEGGHDWIFLFKSLNLLEQSQKIGFLVHTIGSLVVISSMIWAGKVLIIQYKEYKLLIK